MSHKSCNNVMQSLAYGTLNTIDYSRTLYPNCIISKLFQSVCGVLYCIAVSFEYIRYGARERT